MSKEVRITRSQPPCEKLALHMEVISSLLSGYHNQKRKAKKESASNETKINEDNVSKLIEVILSVISEIKRRLDTSAEDNYTRYSSKSKELVHVAVRGWLDANDDNRKLFTRIVNNRDLSHNELSDIIMQNICRYCLGQIKKLANSNLVAEEIHDKAQRGELEVLNMKRIFESKKGMSHLKLLLASLIEVRNILSGTSGTSARLMHSYIVREVEKNLLLTIKVPKDSDLTIEEATEHMIYKYGSLEQNIIEEERDTRYQIPHFIQYHKTDSVRTKAFSRKIFGMDIITKIQKELKDTPDEYHKKNIEISAKKISKFTEISRQSIEMLFKQIEEIGSGIYKKIGKALKELSNDLIEIWDKTNKDINNTANRLKGALSDMIKVLGNGQLEVYPIVDVSSGELIDSLHKFKYDVLDRITKDYLRGKMSDDQLRNTILYVTLKYARDLYRDLIRLFRAKREEMYFAKTGRKIYNYDELILWPQGDEMLESENAEARKSINADRISELIASILIYYVLMHYLKHYERDGLYGDINELGIIDYLNFMLINLESFQASLYDIFYSTILQFVAKSGSLSFLLHNYIRLDNMMYLASIIANSWPLFAPFFSTSSANVWTIYREIENETFAQHDVGPGIITDDIISKYDNNPKEKPFVIFTQIPALWPWNRKSKGIRQISRKELLELEEQYKKWKLKQKENEGQKTEEKYLPTRTTLEELKNDPIIQKLSNEMQEEISILQSIINGYNVVLDLRLLRLHIFYQLNLVYENYKNLKQTIKEHLQKGGIIYNLKNELDQKVEMELSNPIFVRDMQERTSKSKNSYDFDISHVNFAIDIYAPINTIVTRLFFICGLSMQSETGYYIVGEGIVEKEEAKRNFTNWSKALLFNDSDYLIAAYSLNKGLGMVSNKFAKKIKPNSKIVSWVRDKLIKETKRLQPIAEKIIKIHEKIKEILDEEDEESEEK